MAAIKAFDFAPGDDIAGCSRRLWDEGIPHRVYVHEGQALLLVGQPAHVLLARDALQRFRRGEAVAGSARGMPARHALPALAVALRRAPVTLVVIALSVLGALVVEFDVHNRVLHLLTFTGFREQAGRLLIESARQTYLRHEYWRLLTPLFLHFGLMHLVFNMLWLWELGRRVEFGRGSLALAGVVVFTGVGGNLVQNHFNDASVFGGMSGVIYGLLGYMWMWNRFARQVPLALPPGILGFMLAWLLVCASGLIEALGFGAIANAAHFAGLGFGMVLGIAAALLNRGAGAA